MRYPGIEKLLASTIGLDPESVGLKALDRAITARMKLVSLPEETEYMALLRSSEEERKALIESLVVPETWFFRDRGPFVYLREQVAVEWKKSGGGKLFRLLSVPCSTGEEPFSIAITLLQAGLCEADFQIDAVDISARALDMAARGVYTKNSFREKDLDFQYRYFTPTEDGFHIQEPLRHLVRFEQGNVHDPNFPVGRPRYDVIFCRNLLIYMTGAAKKQVLNNLDRLLVEGGLVFTGHTETMLARSYGYLPVGQARVFACRKPCKEALQARQEAKKTPAKRKPLVFPKASPAAAVREADRLPASAAREAGAIPAQDEVAELLARVHELGNRGALEEAERLCKKLLQDHELNSEAYYLMGMLQMASGRYDSAEEWLQKALYLDPNHYAVLVQLYLLFEQKGDSAKAAAFRTRAARSQTLQTERSSQDKT